MNKIIIFISALIISMFVAGCAENVSPNTYTTSEVGKASTVASGVVIGKRAVSVDANSKMGGLVGAGAGAVAGSTIGGSPVVNILGAIGGAVAGGVAGNAIDKGINHHQAYEYIVQLASGSTISVTQTADEQFSVNQRVLVIYGSAMTRLAPDNTVARAG